MQRSLKSAVWLYDNVQCPCEFASWFNVSTEVSSAVRSVLCQTRRGCHGTVRLQTSNMTLKKMNVVVCRDRWVLDSLATSQQDVACCGEHNVKRWTCFEWIKVFFYAVGVICSVWSNDSKTNKPFVVLTRKSNALVQVMLLYYIIKVWRGMQAAGHMHKFSLKWCHCFLNYQILFLSGSVATFPGCSN